MPRRRVKTQEVEQRRDISAAARVVTALDLAIAGHDWETIARLSGYASRGAAYTAVQRELKRRIDERVDSLRTLQLARLGRMRTVYYPKAMEGDGWSMDRVLRLDERESQLMGLDAVRETQMAQPPIIDISMPLAQAVRGQTLTSPLATEQDAVAQALSSDGPDTQERVGDE